MMSLLQGVVLGAVQGLAEFLPVSSSGHLALVPVFFGWKDQGLAFDVVLHLATLGALLWCFWRDLFEMLRKREWGYFFKIGVAALPALILGYLLNDWIEANTRQAWIIALDLAFWATILWWADTTAFTDKTLNILEPTWKQVLAVGLAQPIALLPGTSRSGITITAGLFSGMSRKAAARFSFFVSMPVTAAGGSYGLLKLIQEGAGFDWVMLGAGFITAFLTGIFAIRWLLRYISTNSYKPFIFYRYALAICVLLFT